MNKYYVTFGLGSPFRDIALEITADSKTQVDEALYSNKIDYAGVYEASPNSSLTIVKSSLHASNINMG